MRRKCFDKYRSKEPETRSIPKNRIDAILVAAEE